MSVDEFLGGAFTQLVDASDDEDVVDADDTTDSDLDAVRTKRAAWRIRSAVLNRCACMQVDDLGKGEGWAHAADDEGEEPPSPVGTEPRLAGRAVN